MALVVMKQSGSLKNFEGFLYKNRKRRLYQLLNRKVWRCFLNV